MAPFIELIVGEFAFSFEFAASLAASVVHRRSWWGDRVIEIAEGDGAVAAVAADWREIEHAGGVATPFQTLAVGEAAADVHVRRGEMPRIVLIRDGGRPAALFATVVGRCAGVRSVRFLGDPLNQYGDVIAAPDATREHLEAAWRAAADPAVAKFIHLRKVRGDSRLAPVLARVATVVDAFEAPFVALDRGRLPVTNDSRQFRRSQRRLAEYGAVRFELLRGPAACPALREAVDLKRAWLAQRGLRSRVIGDRDWEAGLMMLAGETGSASPLAVARLSAGERTVAVEIGFVHGRRWCSFLGAFDPAFARSGPGRVQIAETIAHCVAEGIVIYDLLPPADPYKREIAHGTVPVRDYAARLGAGGHAAMLAARAVPAIKSIVERMPIGLRRAVLSRSNA